MNKLILILGITFLAFGCGDKNKNAEPQKTVLEYLTGAETKKWKITSGKLNLANGGEVDILSQPPCTLDNTLMLSKDFTYEADEGSTKCLPADIQTIKGKWSFNESNKTMSVEKFAIIGRIVENAVFIITEANEANFTGKTNVTISGIVYNANVTFSVVK